MNVQCHLFYHNVHNPRVQKLEKKRNLTSFSAILDHEKLGYNLTAIIEVPATKGSCRCGKTHINVSKRVCRIICYWINRHDNMQNSEIAKNLAIL